MNWAKDPPLLKNVEAVPSGPMKVNGPVALLLAPIWNCTDVFAGVEAFQEIFTQLRLAFYFDQVFVQESIFKLAEVMLHIGGFLFVGVGMEKDQRGLILASQHAGSKMRGIERRG